MCCGRHSSAVQRNGRRRIFGVAGDREASHQVSYRERRERGIHRDALIGAYDEPGSASAGRKSRPGNGNA